MSDPDLLESYGPRAYAKLLAAALSPHGVEVNLSDAHGHPTVFVEAPSNPEALASMLAREAPLTDFIVSQREVRPAGALALRDATSYHPVNPFSLARLKTGKVARTRAELVAALGMPLEKILAPGGPLYAPNLEAIAASRGLVRGEKPSGAVSIGPTARLAAATSLAVGAAEAQRIDRWVTQVPDPLGPGSRTGTGTGEASDPEVTRALGLLEAAGVTCAEWLAMTVPGRLGFAQDVIDGTLRRGPSVIRAAVPLSPEATSLAERITRRCETRSSARSSGPASAMGVREPTRLLSMLGLSADGWRAMTCTQQIEALARINSSIATPWVSREEMKTEWFHQWIALYYYANTTPNPATLGNDFFRWGQRWWFEWSSLGTYTNRAPSVTDPQQGLVGNCFFVASLASLAWVRPDIVTSRSWRGGHPPAAAPLGTGISRSNVEINLADPSSGSIADHRVSMSDHLPIVVDSIDLCAGLRPFCHTNDSDQTWPDLYEKAMRVWISGADYPSMVAVDANDSAQNASFNAPLYLVNEEVHPANVLAGGNGQSMIAWISDAARSSFFGDIARALTSAIGFNNDANAVWRYLDEHCDASGKAASVLIASSIPPDFSPPVGIVPWHYYSLLGIDRARRIVYLRNPWGHISPGEPSLQRGSWMGLNLGLDDGVGAVSFQSFYRNFTSVSGNWYGTPRTNDYGLLHRWGFYSLTNLVR